MIGSHIKTAGLILDELKPTGAGGKEGTTEARYFGSFKVADDGTFWVGHLKNLTPLRFGPGKQKEVSLDINSAWCKAKGICPRCLAINSGQVSNTNEGHYCQCRSDGAAGSSRAVKRANQDSAQARIVNQRLDDFFA